MANWAADFELRNNIDPAKIVKRARHGIHVQKGGEIEATFVGAPCHYQDSKGQWQPIDTTLKLNTVTNKYYVPGVAVDLAPDGVASVYGQAWQHKTTRVGIWNPTKRTFVKAWDIPELGAVDGDSFVRSGKGWEYRQRVTESGLKETLTLFTKPSLSLPAGSYAVIETYVPGLSAYPDGETKEWSESGMHFSLPSARDNSGSFMPLPCKRWKLGNYLYTGVSAETFDAAVYPLVVDPDYTSDTGDGQVWGSNSTWVTARSTAGGVATDLTTISVAAWKQDTYYIVARGFLKFDTSSIPDEAVNTEVTLTGTTNDQFGSPTYDIIIGKYSWSSQDPLSSMNKEAAYDGALAATLETNIWGNTATWTAGVSKTSGVLSTDWVSKTGYSYYTALDKQHDRDNSAPSGKDGISLCSANHATASYRPYLTVTYFFPHHRTLLGVGK